MMYRACLLLLLLATPLRAASETDRLAALCRVWAGAKYLHPDVAFGDVDWDAALMRAIPGVRAATTDHAMAEAVDVMLRQLHDSSTRVVESGQHPKPADAPLFGWNGDILVVNAGAYATHHRNAIGRDMRAVFKELPKAKAAIIDVRFHPDDPDDLGDVAGSIDRLPLVTGVVPIPPKQFVFHSGYAPQSGATSGGYYSAVLTIPSAPVPASTEGAPAKVVFVTDSGSALPDAAVALQRAGKAFIVSTESIDQKIERRSRAIPISPNAFAVIRVSASTPLRADLISADPISDALAILRGQKPEPSPMPTAASPEAITPRWKRDATYADMTYPDVEHRILAVFRIWSVIDYFYPYKSLIGDWRVVLPECIPRFIAAANADEYAMAVMEMVARVEDGHSGAYEHPSVDKILGSGLPLIDVRLVENVFVVTKIGDAVPKETGIHPGDVVISVDGEPLRERIARLRKFITASTERARVNRLAAWALAGPKGSDAALEIKGADGATRVVHLSRLPFAPRKPTSAPVYRRLNEHIGYVDLTRLVPNEVDAMFDALWTTDAIIFDMRGYPNGTAWPIAPRINTRDATVGATFRRVQFSGATSTDEAQSGYFFDQRLPISDKPVYRGKTVMLIDDRAISQSEHTCLFFEAANGTTFIGSPTAGANGDVTNFTLPGGFEIYFTGHDVRHADGRQLQRIGIQPDIAVEPTIRGIREGRDEVLDRAVAYINSLKLGGNR